jgi:Fur family transcriptional regulator, peroxide stress response regulator
MHPEIVNPPDKILRIDRFLAAHRERGLPVTTQRRAVFEAILDRTDHPTAEQLYRAVRDELPQISRMTVHRILSGFVSLGLVSKICHPGSAARFDPKLRQHHHLVCLDCGRVIDVEDSRLNNLSWPDVNPQEFQIEDYHIHFRGRCARCRKRPAPLGQAGNSPHLCRRRRKLIKANSRM